MHYIPPDSSYPTDEYKTKKLVLRKIEKGDYKIGSNSWDEYSHSSSGTNTEHSINVPKPYYIAIFELTDNQYRYMNDETGFAASTSPANVSWNTVRGSAGAAASPSTGIIANLNARAKLPDGKAITTFDLPTESMWEIAARAGSSSKYIGGNSVESIDPYAWYKGNASSVQVVGLKLPNALGFYDIIGNRKELCRDVSTKENLATQQKDVFVPISSGIASNRISRGGDISFSVESNLFSARNINQAANGDAAGFRIACYPF